MKIKSIYQLAILMGKNSDIRGDYLNTIMRNKLTSFEKLSEDEKDFYDQEQLSNPYNDTRILVGTGEEEISTVFCGIDVETAEILLVDRLQQKGVPIDAVISHHPEGVALADLHDVMYLQADLLEDIGVPINVAEGMLEPRIREVQRALLPQNHQRAVDAARLLNLPFICVHTPADNLVNNFLKDHFGKNTYSTLEDLINLLLQIPEYRKASELKAGPRIINGDKNNRVGKLYIEMTGGTSGPDKAIEKIAQAGVGTYICMHLTEKHRQLAVENNINVIVAGHMPSDSLGINIFLDQLEKQGIKLIVGSGLIRIKRDPIDIGS